MEKYIIANIFLRHKIFKSIQIKLRYESAG